MEKKSSNGDWEKMKREINELMTEGRDYAHQFRSASSQETREHLAKKILESYHKSLTIMNYSGEQDSSHAHDGGGSPKSDDSDQEPLVITKSSKKSMPKWTRKVIITPGAGIDRTLEDGFSWRKYGQKDILGAKFPRGYFRCTYRKSQGCEATKHVQRSDENQMLFEISYRGKHSCSQAANVGSTIPAQNLEPNQTQEHENLDIVKESLDNYNHEAHLHHNLHYPMSSTPNLESNNPYMLQMRDHNMDFFGSTSFSSDLGTNINYNFPASGSASHSTSNSPSTIPLESPFDSYDPNHPYGGGFGGFY
ncbi:PREDICTED: probable WRKY transcription factor 30 [Camelina sativa]|uniref:Probable WRKY transcription factor 30 n=1 Tax=Camelina sativa TaxID=90675 RepID=A0ABM0VDW4_CAMSA|nr:PREDICTED: probable WRKY transcription factor 30 [Camelina sativa]